jgi:hypothetical protein
MRKSKTQRRIKIGNGQARPVRYSYSFAVPTLIIRDYSLGLFSSASNFSTSSKL